MIGPGGFRLLLALVVVIHHSTPLRLGSWAVYVFLILSGYWIVRTWDQRYQRTRNPRLTFLISRWWRLAPVLLVCLAIAAILAPAWGRQVPQLTPGWVLRQLAILGSSSGIRLLPPQWVLDVEMQFYCAAALLLPWWIGSRVASTSRAMMPLFFGALTLAGSLTYLACGGAAENPRLWPWFGFFLVGMYIWQFNWKSTRRCALAGMGAFGAVTLALLILPDTRNGLIIRGANPVQTHFANWPAVWQAAGALLVVPFVALNVRRPSMAIDRLLGNWAYPLYLFHWIPREWYYRHVDWSFPWWHNAGLLAVNVSGALAGSFAILFLIDRPFDRMRSRWVKARIIQAEMQPAKSAASEC